MYNNNKLRPLNKCCLDVCLVILLLVLVGVIIAMIAKW